MNQEDIKKLHNGLIGCPMTQVDIYMPEIKDIISGAPVYHKDYIVDAKVHMLMPNQFPCIPNWHEDCIPRDSEGDKQYDLCDPNKEMLLWLSGAPLTEFSDGRVVEPQKWITFTQRDSHRGTVSKDFQWRLFIRLVPKEIYPNIKLNSFIRRHSQVYLDSNNFSW